MAKSNYFNYFLVCINAPKETPQLVEELRGYESLLFNSLSFKYVATIIHDKDVYTKDDERLDASHKEGTSKLTHLHAFLEVAKHMTSLQMLKSLETSLKCDKSQISVVGSNNDYLGVQYLTHQNHQEKHQYSKNEIKSSNDELTDERLKKEYLKPKTEDEIILEAFEDSKSATEFMKKVGLDKAKKYLTLYDRYQTEKRQNYDRLVKEIEELKNANENLTNMLWDIIKLFKKNALSYEDIRKAEQTLTKLSGLLEYI